MTPVPTPPPPGNLTVPPLFGWQEIAVVVTLVVVAALVTFAVLAAGTARTGRAEWRASLQERSERRRG